MKDYSSTVVGFPERLNELIYIKNDLTIVAVADAVRINRKTLMRYLKGEGTPNMVILARLCSFFRVSADYMLFGKE